MLIGGLVTDLYLKEVPVASGADHSFQSDTIHGSGTEMKIYSFYHNAFKKDGLIKASVRIRTK